MRAWHIAGGIFSVPGELAGQYSTGYPEFDTLNKVFKELIRRRLLPRRFWYYIKWGYRTHRSINQAHIAGIARKFGGGISCYVDAKYGDWNIFKDVMSGGEQ